MVIGVESLLEVIDKSLDAALPCSNWLDDAILGVLVKWPRWVEKIA